VSRKTRKDEPVEPDVANLPWYRRPGRGAVLSLLTLIGLMVFAGTGLERLKARVDSLPEYNPTPKLVLMDTPRWFDSEGWRPQVLAAIHLPEKPNWLDGTLVQDIAHQLAASGWVSQVKRVTQSIDGSLRVWCDYRQPIAMVETRRIDDETGDYVAIDKDGVRLPQVYHNAGEHGWLEILGVEAVVPEPGQTFKGEDAAAAARLAQIIEQQNIAQQVCAIDVSNFHGRKDKSRNHIFLRLRGPAGPINWTWGSAVGEEFEEPLWQDKIRLIQATLRRGAPMSEIDLSSYRDGVIVRTAPAVASAYGSQPRNR